MRLATKRCKRCIMPETVSRITFNKDGICSFCQNYKEEKYLGEEELERVIASIKKKDNNYDCLVPLSGGRDSTFVLYMAKVRYNLKVLAVNYDNEFRTEQASINMENACEHLNVDFISVRSKRNIAQKMVRYYIRATLPLGSDAVSNILCAACTNGYLSTVYRTAEKFQVPLIMWGASQAEKTSDMQRMANGSTKKRRIIQRLILNLNVNFWKGRYYGFLQRLEFHVPGNNIFSRGLPILKSKDIKEIHLFDYILWDRHKIKETIKRELNWKKPSGSVSSWRIDCHLHALLNLCFYDVFGCSKDCFGYCNMINSGQMNREGALKQEVKTTAFVTNIQELLEEKIGLSKKEAAKINSFRKKT